MTDMVERVAKAIVNCGPKRWEDLADYERRAAMAVVARVAIEAMREPTEAMLACELRFQGEQLGYAEIWRRMIDAALAPEPAR